MSVPGASREGQPVLTFSHVGKTFVGGSRPVHAVDEVDLAIREGEFVTVIGPSGCGKSTLLQIVAGFVQPTQGSIECLGRLVDGINQRVGFISQANDLFPWMTLMENAQFALEARGVPERERRERAQNLIDRVGLNGFEQSYPHQLSGGMQKRGSIVRTMVYGPKIILMDEPFGPLDAQTRLILQSELLRIWASEKMTILFVTHDLVEAISLADRVVVMTRRPGRIKAVIPVAIPRPRNVFEIQHQDGFRETHQRLWNLVQGELGLAAPDQVSSVGSHG
jgi:NitT/TauT family transport system ATP-binding protein